MKQQRLKFDTMWKHFSTVNVNVPTVGEIIGGKVQQNIIIGMTHPNDGFKNACAIRMSYALHHSGIIFATGDWVTVSGADKKGYIFRVTDMKKFLYAAIGKPDKSIANPMARDFSNNKGILVFTKQFGDASGHVTLWNGHQCADHCYFEGATKAELWLLK